MKQTNKRLIYIVLPLLLVVTWGILATRTFNEKPDLNGDNISYYIYASSLATGHGYSDLSAPGSPATANFPPGYPLLMTPLRWLTDSIVAQKWLNEVFVLGGVLLLFFCLLRLAGRWDISFAAAFAGLFCPRLWHFSTMMMSEASFFMTSVLVIYAIIRWEQRGDDRTQLSDLKAPWLYVMLVSLLLNYHIRTQGLALVAAVFLYLLIRKRWLAFGTTALGFVTGCLPYIVRNKILGLNGGRYLDTIMLSNPFRPEEGTLTITEVIGRFFDTMRMLVFNAIPNTIFPYIDLNCDQPTFSFGLYLLGVVLVAVMVIGFFRLGKTGWLLSAYLVASLSLISIFSTPSGNRYITTLLPLLMMGLFLGIWQIAEWALRRRPQWLVQGSALALCLLLFAAKDGLQAEAELSKQKYPMQYVHFFNIAKQAKKIAAAEARQLGKTESAPIVCSRKPQMFWMYSGLPGVNYLFTQDADALISDLAKKKVDYVVLDALGYSSTYLYLYPAIRDRPQHFPEILAKYDNSHTYLLRFKP